MYIISPTVSKKNKLKSGLTPLTPLTPGHTSESTRPVRVTPGPGQGMYEHLATHEMLTNATDPRLTPD